MLQIKLEKLKEIASEKPDKFQQYMTNMAQRQVRIYSGEHSAYWRQLAQGYCTKAAEAGIYTLEEAYDFTRHCGPEKKIQFNFLSKLDTPQTENHD